MPPATPAIETMGLTVRYGSRTAVDGVDLAVGAGEVLALLGRNGAGKTSTVEALEGYRRPAAGQMRVLGLDPARAADHRALTRRVGVMLQRGGVYPGMSPAEALHLFAAYYDDPWPPGDLLDRLDLGGVSATPWRRLSGGEQQRLSMALALVGRPDVAFLDEPTAGVDPAGRLAIRGQIADLRARGVAVLITTHELEEAERIADRIVIMHRGRVVAAGTTADLVTSDPALPGLSFTAPPGLDTAALGGTLGAPVAEAGPGDYRVAGGGDPAMVARLTAWLAERDVTVGDLRSGARLEDVFLRLTADGEEG
ncbi:MAG TPA: ABC transporter ATP-binding protein [Acidimicrobiales bacterium]|nr:ABC transporter ATP-binding protein [Acidimicrobiales bacterium]